MKKIKLLLQDKKIPYETQTKIKRYLEFVLKQEQKEDPEHENFIMSKLSSELRNEIYLHTNVRLLKKVPAFQNFGEKTLISLARFMKKVCFGPEEFVFKAGDYDNTNIFFVINGNLKIVSAKDEKIMTVWKSLKVGDHFGDREIFTGLAKTNSVLSEDFSTLFKLSRSDTIQVLKRFPSDYEKFCEMKDLDILYGEHHQYEEPCISCGYKDHIPEKCGFLRYNPNIRVILHKYFEKCKKKARNFKRKKQKRHHALINKEDILSARSEFMSLYQDDDEIIDLLKIYNGEQASKATILSKETPKPHQKSEFNDEDEAELTQKSKLLKESANSEEFKFTKCRRRSARAASNQAESTEHHLSEFIIKKPRTPSMDESPRNEKGSAENTQISYLPNGRRNIVGKRRTFRENKQNSEHLTENDVKRSQAPSEDLSLFEKECLENSQFFSFANENNENACRQKIMKSQKTPDSKDLCFISNGECNQMNLLGSIELRIPSCSLGKDAQERKATKSFFQTEKTHSTKSLMQEYKEGKQMPCWSENRFDVVRIFQNYFPPNNITQIIKKKKKVSTRFSKHFKFK